MTLFCALFFQADATLVQIFDSALEKVEPYNEFVDFCSTFHLTRGKNVEQDEDEDIVGEFKVNFPITHWVTSLFDLDFR